jgi:CRP-like cAMP-binding protein
MNWTIPQFGFADIPANLSYIAIALSYYVRGMLWLRILAVIGIALEIIYFALTSSDLFTGIVWNLIFILINVVQIARLLWERRSLRLPLTEKLLLRELLAGLDDLQIARLLKASEWRTLEPGALLTCERKPVKELYLLGSGRAIVEVHGTPVAQLERGSFVGEVALLTGEPASASVIIKEKARILAFPRAALDKAFQSDNEIAGLLHKVLGRDLAIKMRYANEARTGSGAAKLS